MPRGKPSSSREDRINWLASNADLWVFNNGSMLSGDEQKALVGRLKDAGLVASSTYWMDVHVEGLVAAAIERLEQNPGPREGTWKRVARKLWRRVGCLERGLKATEDEWARRCVEVQAKADCAALAIELCEKYRAELEKAHGENALLREKIYGLGERERRRRETIEDAVTPPV
jgi:hypothetical protein